MKKRNILATAIWVLMTAFAFSACQKSVAENTQTESQLLQPTISPMVNLSPPPTPNLDSPIRKIDFDNFMYPETEDYPETFTLKNGEKPFEVREENGINLFRTEYSDLTNDGEEEAILTMSIQTGGSSIPNLIYIYTLKNNKPKVLWGFKTGDRAVGGLKKVYVEDGELIVELFGDSKVVNGKWSLNVPKDKYLGDGRPTVYTKNRFKWDGKKFAIQGRAESFDYDVSKEMNKQ